MKKIRKSFKIITAMMLIFLLLVGCVDSEVTDNKGFEKVEEIEREQSENDKPIDEIENKDSDPLGISGEEELYINKEIKEGSIEIHFIDVGQGDCILIMQESKSMLIDAGENHKGEAIVRYIEDLGVEKLEYVVGTHPHSDHIGGLDNVIDNFEIGKVIMPKVTHTTKTFEDVIISIQNKGLKITTPVVGESYDLGEANFIIIAPNSEKYSNLNNYSVGIKLSYGGNNFIFTGDAEVQSEIEMLNNGIDLKADLLKLGHHGSNTSNTDDFLDKVDPKYAVIQAGEGNQYGHPNIETLAKLSERGIETYRNDTQGTIIVEGDGKELKFNSLPTSKEYIVEEKDETNGSIDADKKGYSYIGNIKSKIYHTSNCSSLPQGENRVKLDSKEHAEENGYRACKRCKP